MAISFSANAYRQEYGRFGNWDAYYLTNQQGEQICAARGYFEGGYKVIFNVLIEPDGTDYLKLNIENPNWSIPPGETCCNTNSECQWQTDLLRKWDIQ